MPIDPDGEKWACEPCIRGHRSTKCEHFDRFMMRVKRPGRPLSKCPHPKGKCGCAQEKVLMARIPKDGVCLCKPAPNVPRVMAINGEYYAVSGPPAASKHKVMKHPQRQGSVTVPKNAVQGIARDSEPENDGRSPWLNATHEGPQLLTDEEKHNLISENASEDRKPRLQLGMMGVGGYGTAKDEIGWQGSWPELDENLKQEHRDSTSGSHDCCSNGSAQPKTHPHSSSKACCGSATDSSLTYIPISEAMPSLSLYESSTLAMAPQHSWSMNSAATILPAGFARTTPPFQSPPQDQSQVFQNGDGVLDQRLGSLQRHPSDSQRPPSSLSDTNHFIVSSSQQDHTCNCGEHCQCVGCATHPNNVTTRTRMQELDDIMALGEHEEDSDRSNSRPQTAYGDVTAWNANSTGNPLTSFNPNLSLLPSGLPDEPITGLDGFNTPVQQFLYQNPNNHVNMGPNYSQVLMSPSTYVTVEYPLGAWNDCTNYLGSCRCGNDCLCTGCLTHSGHNGVPLDSADIVPGHNSNTGSISAPELPPSFNYETDFGFGGQPYSSDNR